MLKPLNSTHICNFENSLYRLNYMERNKQEYRLIKFDAKLNIEEAIRICKEYCARNNWRFVFVEPAITTIGVDFVANTKDN